MNKSKFSRYKNVLLLIAYTFGIFIVFISTGPTGSVDSSPFLPGDTFFMEMVCFYIVFIPIITIIASLLGYLLTPMFLFLFKVFLGRKMTYGIQENKDPGMFKDYFRGVFPALMAINFAMMFSTNDQFVFLFSSYAEYMQLYGISYILGYFVAFIVLLIFTMGISIAIFSPVWFLLDSGIVFLNRNLIEKKNTSEPVEGRAVGSYFLKFLKGYTGVGVIFTFIEFMSLTYNELRYQPQSILTFLIHVVLLPFFLSVANLPSIIVLDLLKKHRIKFTLKVARKLGITENVKIVFENIDKSD
ncbi:MAG: hypothetical protein ACFFCS_21320 [Candidatus Hodarchaeota archaeon]